MVIIEYGIHTVQGTREVRHVLVEITIKDFLEQAEESDQLNAAMLVLAAFMDDTAREVNSSSLIQL